MCAESVVRRGIPDATVSRLPTYLRILTELSAAGVTRVSSEELAEAARVRPTQLRKDLSLLGSNGVRGVGYAVEQLTGDLSAVLGLPAVRPVAIVGMGNLGRALAAYTGFASSGFTVRALVDTDPQIVGTSIGGIVVTPLDDLAGVVRDRGIVMGLVATPAEAAEAVCDRLVAAGVRSILTFAPTALRPRPGVGIRRVDLATELHILAVQDRYRDVLDDLEVLT